MTKNMAKCNAVTEVFSRVVGYFRPVKNWNKGKREEFNERKVYEVTESLNKKEKADAEKKP